MSSQSAGNEPPTRPKSSTRNPTQSTQPSILKNVESVTNAVLSILKDTVWPRRSTDMAHELIQVIENASSLKGIPKENLNIKAEHRASLERFVAVMVNVQPKLQEASDTYGAKKRRFRSRIKYLFTYLGRNKCTQVLESCQNEVQDALVSLPDNWAPELTTGDVTSPGPVKEQSDPETEPVTRVVTSQSTIVVASPSQDEESAAPGDQVISPSKRREWLGGMKTTFTAVEGVSGMIPVIGTYVGAAAKVGATIVEIIQQMGDNEEAAEDLTSHTGKLSDMLKRFEHGSVDQIRGDLTTVISNLQRELQNVQKKVTELGSTSVLRKAFSVGDRAEALKGYQETIRKVLEQIQLLATLNTAAMITELYDEGIREQQHRLLDRLGDANYGARGDAIEDVTCLQGTRVEILEHINSWVGNTSTSEKVFWIRGMAGRGKSTIASTVAAHWKYRAASAIFHFRRGQNETDKRLICALARQLGNSALFPEVKEAILQSIREQPDISQGRLWDQFQTLFLGPLSRLQNTHSPILLVIDALDECKDVEYAVNFVKFLDQSFQSLPVNVKVLLTTRPEAPLIRALEPSRWHAEDLDETVGIDDDIEAFLQHGFSGIRKEYGIEGDWPTRDQLRAIVEMSQGLFQWARTAIEYMKEGSPEDRLQELLDLPSICHGMDDLYLKILGGAFEKAKKNSARGELFIRLLGTLVVTPYPISLETLAYLFADYSTFRNKSPENIIRYLRLEVLVDLGSLIHVSPSSTGHIRLMHTSIRDLLVDMAIPKLVGDGAGTMLNKVKQLSKERLLGWLEHSPSAH
ncbi:hypothetical protein FRC01_007779 [Tulasnella sp. 417]|nr:hypothetical protein FRC01_007779 [Tulasnella sp. 417]